jgi:hypothetical protein
MDCQSPSRVSILASNIAERIRCRRMSLWAYVVVMRKALVAVTTGR